MEKWSDSRGDRMGEASFCYKVRRREGWLWLCFDEMFRLPRLPEALTFLASEPGQEFKFQNESMQRCRTRTECKINDNNMGTNETDQRRESARLWLCYIGESLIKKSKLRAASGAKVSIKFRPFSLEPVWIFGPELAALLRCECAAYLHVFVCLDARICGARLQYRACDRVGLWDRGWTARWMSERNRGWRSICQTQHWAEEQERGRDRGEDEWMRLKGANRGS